ncbi:MAG: hypothetical protein NT062_03690 [Proteobacteria bacterium]|nr:hypothetical protein [Pseudomonadota bacterium]
MAILASLSITACVDDADSGDGEISEASQAVVSTNALSFNRIATNRIATNRIATNGLGQGVFALDTASAGELLSTPEGRELLTYVVSCALAKTQVLEGSYAGTTYTFGGDIGLASAWVDRALDPSAQRWVSACLLSRVNAHDISVFISLRGQNPHLDVGATEAAAYVVEEGAFYGNVFVEPEAPLIAFACRGLDQAKGETAPGTPLADRDCTEPSTSESTPGKTQCGFTFAGNCGAFAGGSTRHDDDDDDAPHACEGQAKDGGYRKCHTRASAEPEDDAAATRYREVITVFLTP